MTCQSVAKNDTKIKLTTSRSNDFLGLNSIELNFNLIKVHAMSFNVFIRIELNIYKINSFFVINCLINCNW